MNTAVVLPDERRAHVARYAKGALLAAGVVGRIPTPLDEVSAALNLSTPQELYDLADVPPALAQRLRRLKHKVKGALDLRSRTIYVTRDQLPGQQRFTHGHELGHHGLPWHQDAYYGDDCTTLDPFTRDELEAEASAFGVELIFNLGEFTERAHCTRLNLAIAVDLADQFEASRHATIRRYVEDAPRACALLVLGRYPVYPAGHFALKVMNGIESVTFRDRFGPIEACFPAALPLTQYRLAMDGFAVLQGRTIEPIADGTIVLPDTRRGSVEMIYEVYSNTYQIFALIYPRPRFNIRRSVRAEWTS